MAYLALSAKQAAGAQTAPKFKGLLSRGAGSLIGKVVASGSKWRVGAGELQECSQARSGSLSNRS